jgi:hypothetical protein
VVDVHIDPTLLAFKRELRAELPEAQPELYWLKGTQELQWEIEVPAIARSGRIAASAQVMAPNPMDPLYHEAKLAIESMRLQAVEWYGLKQVVKDAEVEAAKVARAAMGKKIREWVDKQRNQYDEIPGDLARLLDGLNRNVFDG